MLKQALEFDTGKINLGQHITIIHQNRSHNGIITMVSTRKINVFAFINNKHSPEKFQHIQIDVKDVADIDSTLPVPFLYTHAIIKL